MILKKVKLKNITVFDDAEVSFPDAGIIGFIGPTGSGKTTLLQSLFYALYAKDPYRDTSLYSITTKGKKSSLIAVTFDYAGCEYEIERTWRMVYNKKKESFSYVPNSHSIIIKENKKELLKTTKLSTADELLRKFGDEDVIRFSNYFYQDSFNLMSLSSLQERREYLLKLLAMDLLKEIEYLQEKVQNEITWMEKRMDGIEVERKMIQERINEIKESRKENMKSLMKRLHDTEETIKKLKDEYARIVGEIANLSAAAGNINTIKAIIKENYNSYQTLKKKFDTISGKYELFKKEIAALTKRLKCGNLYKTCPFYKKAVSQNYMNELKLLRDEMLKVKDTIDKWHNKLNEEKNKLQVDDINKALNNLQKRKEELKKETEEYERQYKDLLNLQNIFSLGEQEIKKYQKKLKALEKEYNKLDEQLKLYSQLKTALSRTGLQTYIIEHRKKYLEGILNDLLERAFKNSGTFVKMQFRTMRKTLDGNITSDMGIDIYLNNSLIDFRLLSGGQKRLITFIMNCAIALYKLLLKENQWESIYLDEITSAISKEYIDSVYSIFDVLKKYYKQIFLVTHLESLASLIEHPIYINNGKIRK